MVVRVMGLDKFWETYSSHKVLIDKCFYHTLRRFPNPDGHKDAYNLLLQRLYELDVFNKFNLKRLLAKKLNLNKKHCNTLITDNECSRENLLKHGIDPDKKWQQFIFKYIEHILNEAYNQRKRQSARFISCQEITECPPRSITEMRDALQESPWAQNQNEQKILDAHLEKKNKQDYIKFYPTFKDSHKYVGTPGESPLEEASVNEIQTKVLGILEEGVEKKIYNLLMEGLMAFEIAEVMGTSSQYISNVIKSIRVKTIRYLELPKDYAI